LTTFVVEASKQFENDPSKITNNILIALYNKPTNGTPVPEISISDFMQDARDYSKAIWSNGLLFASLALSVVISMMAMTAKLWIIRYLHRVRSLGSAYDRAMQRQEAYSGVRAWKLGTIINLLPLLIHVPVFLFGLYIQ
jgi:hypothetical protein